MARYQYVFPMISRADMISKEESETERQYMRCGCEERFIQFSSKMQKIRDVFTNDDDGGRGSTRSDSEDEVGLWDRYRHVGELATYISILYSVNFPNMKDRLWSSSLIGITIHRSVNFCWRVVSYQEMELKRPSCHFGWSLSRNNLRTKNRLNEQDHERTSSDHTLIEKGMKQSLLLNLCQVNSLETFFNKFNLKWLLRCWNYFDQPAQNGVFTLDIMEWDLLVAFAALMACTYFLLDRRLQQQVNQLTAVINQLFQQQRDILQLLQGQQEKLNQIVEKQTDLLQQIQTRREVRSQNIHSELFHYSSDCLEYQLPAGIFGHWFDESETWYPS